MGIEHWKEQRKRAVRRAALGTLMTLGVTGGLGAASEQTAEAAQVTSETKKDHEQFKIMPLEIGRIDFAPNVYTKEQQDDISNYLLFQDQLFRATLEACIKQGLPEKHGMNEKEFDLFLRMKMQGNVNKVKLDVGNSEDPFQLNEYDKVPKDQIVREQLIKDMVDKFIANLEAHQKLSIKK